MSDASFIRQEVRFPSDVGLGHKAQEEILAALRAHHYPDKTVFGIRLAVEEAIVNAITHGNQNDPAKTVRVAYLVSAQEFHIEIEDEGAGFNPADVPDPTLPENLERPSGRGLLLMRAYMTECDFIDRGNICRMRRVLE